MSDITCSLIHGEPILEVGSCDPITEVGTEVPISETVLVETDPLAIFNAALSKLGDKLLVSSDEDSIRGRVMRENWDRVRRAVLRDHPWQSVQRRVRITDDSGCEDAESYSYGLDECVLRVLDVEPVLAGCPVKWAVRGRKLIVKSTDIHVLVLYDIDDATHFEPLLYDALVAKLAYEVAPSLTRDHNLKDQMRSEYRSILMDAHHADSTEHSPDDYRVDIGQGEAARYGLNPGPNYNNGYDPMDF